MAANLPGAPRIDADAETALLRAGHVVLRLAGVFMNGERVAMRASPAGSTGTVTVEGDGAGVAHIRVLLAPENLDATAESSWVAGRVEVTGLRDADFALTLDWGFAAAAWPRVLVPGVHYGSNGAPETRRVFPKFAPGADAAGMTGPDWSFRADRAMTPAVLLHDGTVVAAVAADAYQCGTDIGLGFASAPAGGHAGLRLHVPFAELPASYATCRAGHADGFAPRRRLRAGETLWFRFRVTLIEAAEFSACLALHRTLARFGRPSPAPEAADASAIAAAAADGLYLYHYDAARAMLYETASFDKYFPQSRGEEAYVDRPHMHVSWISGVPHAFALIVEADRRARDAARGSVPAADLDAAGRSVITRICTEGISPCGAFWGQVSREGTWDAGWNPDPSWLHTATVAEAALWLAEAVAHERAHGRTPDAAWHDALARQCEFALSVQQADGNFGTYYDAATGAVTDTRGTGGVLWIAALLRAADALGAQPEARARYFDASRRAGHFYAPGIEDLRLAGGCEDIHLSPSSESYYAAVLACVALHDTEPEGAPAERARWLALAVRAADGALTFRMSYDAEFAEGSVLRAMGLRTRGADVASPPNPHLHNYGLITTRAFERLARLTRDATYWHAARAHVAYALQLTARTDGHWNARRGMTGEQVYHTDWWQPKGTFLNLSHAWCCGYNVLFAESECLRAAEP